MNQSNEPVNTTEVTQTFYGLVKELENFVDTSQLKIAFDKDRNAYLLGANFTEPLQPQKVARLYREEMRELIARHVPRIHPDQTPTIE